MRVMTSASLGIDAGQLAGLDQRSDCGPMVRSAIGTGEECILACQSQWPDGPFDRIVIDLDTTVVEEQAQPIPSREGIADRLGEFGLLADQCELLAQPRLECRDQRPAVLLTDGAALLGGLAADVALDLIDRGD